MVPLGWYLIQVAVHMRNTDNGKKKKKKNMMIIAATRNVPCHWPDSALTAMLSRNYVLPANI